MGESTKVLIKLTKIVLRFEVAKKVKYEEIKREQKIEAVWRKNWSSAIGLFDV